MDQLLGRLVVELRHDTIVRGILTEADDEMNLIMEKATYEPLQACIQLPNHTFMHSVVEGATLLPTRNSIQQYSPSFRTDLDTPEHSAC